MNKGELVDKLAVRLGDRKVASRAVDDLLDIINRAIAKGEKVSITGFGTFEKVGRPARTARNPRTGETVKLRKTSVPKFRPGAHLKGVASGSVKLGREPKPEPLLPTGVTSVRAQKALAEIPGAPAAPARTTVKAAAGPAKRTPGAAKTAAKQVTGGAVYEAGSDEECASQEDRGKAGRSCANERREEHQLQGNRQEGSREDFNEEGRRQEGLAQTDPRSPTARRLRKGRP